LTTTFVDLGMSPPCERFLTEEQVDQGETFYPLHVRFCDACLLVQLPAYLPAEEIFTDYAYFSSFSDSWVAHARRFVDEAVTRLRLGSDSFVVEVASNDGYLLQHVVSSGIRALGIEPAENVAEVALERGVPTEVLFLGLESATKIAAEHGKADLVVANNVFAHVPDIVDFTKGLRELVAEDGRITIEIPHLLRLIEGREYDTIYHEHYSYLTLFTTQRVLATAGLTVVDVEELPTHGGSLRTWSAPTRAGLSVSPEVGRVLREEEEVGLHCVAGHQGFASAVSLVRNDLVEFLVGCARRGETVVAYGAPGKGNTLLNHCGIRSDLLRFAVDRNPYKHGRFMPGSHIPVHAVEALTQARPEYVLILPWNLRDEISAQLQYIRSWGGRFVVPLPQLEVW
jgi:SAM-dependent methyltransferase